MSTDLATIPHDPAALDRVDDPAAVMVALVDQARSMLAQATGMEGLADVIEWKSRAEAIRVYTQQKDMGHEAELSAAEIVRRAERRIGQLIRDGQEAGEIAKRGDIGGGGRGGDAAAETRRSHREHLESPKALLGNTAETKAVYGMTDGVTEADFEQAITEAKEEGNLSRANVLRKVKPTTGDRIAQAAKAHPAEPPRNMPLAERAEQIRTLARRNYTSPQIADEVGVSADRVRDIAKRADIEIPADAVFGVDNSGKRLGVYPHDWNLVDAIEFVLKHGHEFDVIHASPPCTGYTRGTAAIPDRLERYDRLIGATREALQIVGRPYVIENVADARKELHDPVMLCGRMFGLGAIDTDGTPLVLDRHRLFESTLPLWAPVHMPHDRDVQVAGAYGGARRDKHEARHVRKGGYVPPSLDVLRSLLGTPWMTEEGCFLSIPPVYTEHIGRQVLAQIGVPA